MEKSVFVTGAAYGTGYAIAERFAKEGYAIFISGRKGEQVEQAAKKLSDTYHIYARGYQTTLFNQLEVTQIFEDIAEFEDIANAVWYFADDVSRNTTGAELAVDGGMLAQLTPDIERELWR